MFFWKRTWICFRVLVFLFFSWDAIVNYVNKQYESYLTDESGLNRRNIIDNRVHCCLYFINPVGHGWVFYIHLQFLCKLIVHIMNNDIDNSHNINLYEEHSCHLNIFRGEPFWKLEIGIRFYTWELRGDIVKTEQLPSFLLPFFLYLYFHIPKWRFSHFPFICILL